MRYDLQAGWYSIGAGADLPCRWIIVSNGDVPDAVLFAPMPRDVIERGRDAAIEIARRYRASEVMGEFAGMDGGESEVEFDPPVWAGGGGKEVEVGDGTTGEASEL
jgi:hypothetical protein